MRTGMRTRRSINVAALVLATLSAQALMAAPDCNDPKHQDKPACNDDGGGGGGGNELDGKFDVLIDGDLGGSGTDWFETKIGRSPAAEHYPGTGSAGEIVDLSYFDDVFSFPRALNCFGTDPVDLYSAILQKNVRKDLAATYFFFNGKTDDGETTVLYMLRMWGTFDESDDWLPEVTNTMNLTTWRLAMEDPYRSQYSNVSCVGEGEFDSGVSVEVTRTQ